MNESIRRWNQENHVTENIAAAFRVVADSTQRAFDSLFPSMTVPQPSASSDQQGGVQSNQPVSDQSAQSMNGQFTQPMNNQWSQSVTAQWSQPMHDQPNHINVQPMYNYSYTPIQPIPAAIPAAIPAVIPAAVPAPSTTEIPSAPAVEANLTPQDESKFPLCFNKHGMSTGETAKTQQIRSDSIPPNTEESTALSSSI